MKVLCVFGKYQYGRKDLGIGTEYAAFLPALRNLGHEVLHFDSWDKTACRDYGEINRLLLHTVEQFRPEVLLSVQMNYEIWLETLCMIKSRGDVATISWTTDDSWKYREVSRFIGHAYHAMTTTYPQVLPKYKKDGIKHVLLTQWAANSAQMFSPVPAEQCRYDISFVGAAHGNRNRRIDALRRRGIRVACFGHGWPSGPVAAADIPEIMRQSVISLNFSNSRGENQIKARTFEVPGAGGFLLTESAPGLEKIYQPGKEIDIFHNMNELEDKIRYYLNNPLERDRVAQAGYNRTAACHTYENRMDAVVKFAIEACRSLKKAGDEKHGPSLESVLRQHRLNPALKIVRAIIQLPCELIWGKHRGPRAARRLIFELSWRLSKEKTFTASGLPGRLFPQQ